MSFALGPALFRRLRQLPVEALASGRRHGELIPLGVGLDSMSPVATIEAMAARRTELGGADSRAWTRLVEDRLSGVGPAALNALINALPKIRAYSSQSDDEIFAAAARAEGDAKGGANDLAEAEAALKNLKDTLISPSFIGAVGTLAKGLASAGEAFTKINDVVPIGNLVALGAAIAGVSLTVVGLAAQVGGFALSLLGAKATLTALTPLVSAIAKSAIVPACAALKGAIVGIGAAIAPVVVAFGPLIAAGVLAGTTIGLVVNQFDVLAGTLQGFFGMVLKLVSGVIGFIGDLVGIDTGVAKKMEGWAKSHLDGGAEKLAAAEAEGRLGGKGFWAALNPFSGDDLPAPLTADTAQRTQAPVDNEVGIKVLVSDERVRAIATRAGRTIELSASQGLTAVGAT